MVLNSRAFFFFLAKVFQALSRFFGKMGLEAEVAYYDLTEKGRT